MTFLQVALLVLRKDVAIELKSYEIVSTTVFFAVSVVVIFAFGLPLGGDLEYADHVTVTP